MRMMEIDPYLILESDGFEGFPIVANWQPAPPEPNLPDHHLPVGPSPVQVIPISEPIVEVQQIKGLASNQLLSADKLTYADIAAGRRSPSVSRQATMEGPSEPSTIGAIPSESESNIQTQQESIAVSVPPIQPSHSIEDPERSKWDQHEQEKLTKSVDTAAERPKKHSHRRRANKTPERAQKAERLSPNARLGSITPGASFEAPIQEEPEVSETKQTEWNVSENKMQRRTTLSPPSDEEKRSRSPLWMPGSGQPSYADILRGHYIPHHQRGMTGLIVDTPQQQIEDPIHPELDQQLEEFIPSVPMDAAIDQTSGAAATAPSSWMVPEPRTMMDYQLDNQSFDDHYTCAPETEATFVPDYNYTSLQDSRPTLEYSIHMQDVDPPCPSADHGPITQPTEQSHVEHPKLQVNIESPKEDPVPPQVVEPVPEQKPVLQPKSVGSGKLSYAQILAAGLRLPSGEPEQRRDSSGSISASPIRLSTTATSNLAVTSPVRGVSEPREPRSRQRPLKTYKAKSFDVRDKEPTVSTKQKKPKETKSSRGGSSSEMDTQRTAKTRPQHHKQKSTDSQNAPEELPKKKTAAKEVEVATVAPVQVKTTKPASPPASRSPVASEPEMTKAMMTFYGISSEDIEQLISSRSQDSDSDAEVETGPHEIEKKKKVTKKKKHKSPKVASVDEDEIEKALREISELEKSKKHKVKRTHSHETKEPSVPPQPTEKKVAELLPTSTEVNPPTKKNKKLKKAASVSGGGETSTREESVKSSSTLQLPKESSSGDDSSTSQRRSRINRAKTVSFSQEVTVHSDQPESVVKAGLEEPLTVRTEPAIAAPEIDPEFVVIGSPEETMSDDIVVLETQNLDSKGHLEGQSAINSQIFEVFLTETACVFESEAEKLDTFGEQPTLLQNTSDPESHQRSVDTPEKPILVAEENKSDDKVSSEWLEDLPLGAAPVAAMSIQPHAVEMPLRKISATSTIPFNPDELALLLDKSENKPMLNAVPSIDCDCGPMEMASAQVLDVSHAEIVTEFEPSSDALLPSQSAQVSDSYVLPCIPAMTHWASEEEALEHLPLMARQTSIAEEEFADDEDLNLFISTTPIPPAVEAEEDQLTSAMTVEPPTTNIYTPSDLPSQEQMVDIVEALLKDNLEEQVAVPEQTRAREEVPPPEIALHVTTDEPTDPVASQVVTSPICYSPVSNNPYGFEDADHVVLSPQWMRQPLGRTFSLDPRSLSTSPKPPTSANAPLIKAHSTDLSESYGTEEQKAAATKRLEEGSKSECQTGGEADDEEVEVYWRLREKKKKKKRRVPVQPSAPSTIMVRSDSSSDARSLSEVPTSPISMSSDITISGSTPVTSEDERRMKSTQDDGFQSEASTPIVPSTEITTPDEFGKPEEIKSIQTPDEDYDELVQEQSTTEVEEEPNLAELTNVFHPSTSDVQQEEPKCTDEVRFEESIKEDDPISTETVEPEAVQEVTHTTEQSAVESRCPATNEELELEAVASVSPNILDKVTSWASLVATGKPKASEPPAEPEPVMRPPRPLPILLVVDDTNDRHQNETFCDPDGFHIGRKERKRRKWRSSQSESQDVEAEAEAILVETAPEMSSMPTESHPEEQQASEKQIIIEAVVESGSDDPEEVAIHRQPSVKASKLSKSVRELEQRKRRSRLSESEQEVLQLAEAIAENRDVSLTRSPLDEHLKNLYLDSWPKKPTSQLVENEDQMWITQTANTNVATEFFKPTDNCPAPKGEEEKQNPDEGVNLEDEKNLSTPGEDEFSSECVPESMQELIGIVTTGESGPSDSPMSWASIVATSKPVVAESMEEVPEEPVRPKRPLPTLIVVGEEEHTSAPVSTDPESFTEFLGRKERRRRKWRASQSESQDCLTDDEHGEVPLIEALKEELPPIAQEPPTVSEATAPSAEEPETLRNDMSEEKESDELPILHLKDRPKTVHAKESFPVKEAEQRRRRHRLSESEKEAFELADAIEKGQPTPQLYYDLFADSWPGPFCVFHQEAEKRWKLQEGANHHAPSGLDDAQIGEVAHAQQETMPEVEVQEVPAESQSSDHVILQTVPVETEQVSQSYEEILGNEAPLDRPISPAHVVKPLSWAALVASSKATVTEEAPAAEEPVAPPKSAKQPVLLVVGEDPSVAASYLSDDPDGFHECISKREKKRRKWRSSQSESQDTEVDPVAADTKEEAPEVETCPPVPPPVVAEQEREDIEEPIDSPPTIQRERVNSKTKRPVKEEKQTKEAVRKRQKRRSESEREALKVAEAIESGTEIAVAKPSVPEKPSDSFWVDKIAYSDIEKNWQESLSRKDEKTVPEMRLGFSRDRSPPAPPDSDPKGSDPSPPPSSGSPNSRFPSTQYTGADLPTGTANWSDESTYLAIDNQLQKEKVGKQLHHPAPRGSGFARLFALLVKCPGLIPPPVLPYRVMSTNPK